MDIPNLLISERLCHPHTFFLGMTFFFTAGSLYQWYLFNTIFKNQQRILQENQQHQYQIYRDLLSLVFTKANLNINPVLPTINNIPKSEPKVPMNLKSSNISHEKSNNDSKKEFGFLSELKEVLKKRDNN